MLTSVKRLRLELGYTQFAIAAKSGIHPSRLSLIETARVEPRAEELQRLAEALAVPPDLLTRHRNEVAA